MIKVRTDREEGLSPEATDYAALWIDAKYLQDPPQAKPFTIVLGTDTLTYTHASMVPDSPPAPPPRQWSSPARAEYARAASTGQHPALWRFDNSIAPTSSSLSRERNVPKQGEVSAKVLRRGSHAMRVLADCPHKSR